jgi:Mn2+/Fe2+ NRAMP family transporter
MASLSQEPAHDAPAPTTGAAIPTTFAGYLKGMGPGIVVVMSWLGTGDFIGASVAGSNYGYALIWTLLIAVMSRYFIVSAIAKYQLCNQVGDKTILDGFRRVWQGFPLYLGVTTCMLGFVYCCFLYIATGTALSELVGMVMPLGPWGPFLGALVSLALAIWIVTRGNQQMRWLEILANITMTILVLSFFAALLRTGIDFGALLSGLAFELPAGENGYITAVSTSVALIGAVGGSAANLLYPYLIHDKGWTGPQHRKLQNFDLLFGTMVMFVLVLAVWVVAAETLHGTGEEISSEAGLANMMQKAIGPAGPAIMWTAIFFTVFNNIITQPPIFVRLLMESVYMANPERQQRVQLQAQGRAASAKSMFRYDTAYWCILIPVMTFPVLFSLPGMPGMVVVTMMGISFSVLTVPPIMVGLMVMTTRRDLMLQPYINRWWETAILAGIGLVGLWATYELIGGLIGNFLPK